VISPENIPPGKNCLPCGYRPVNTRQKRPNRLLLLPRTTSIRRRQRQIERPASRPVAGETAKQGAGVSASRPQSKNAGLSANRRRRRQSKNAGLSASRRRRRQSKNAGLSAGAS